MEPPQGAADWFRIENSADDADSTDVYVYGSIGGFWGIYADEFIEELRQVKTSNINLRLNSGGGSVFEGVAVANAIRAHPANVTVYVDSLAASIASVIMLAGDKIVFMPQAQCMIHNASGACYGGASDMTKMADLLDRQTKNIAEAYSQRTGRPVSEFLDLMDQETWLSAQEALDIGLADELYMPPKKEEECAAPTSALMNRTWDLSMYRYAGREQAPAPTAFSATVVDDTADTLQQIDDTTTPVDAAEKKLAVDVRSPEFADQMRTLIREAIRAELAVIEGTAVGSHSTAVKEGTWDAGANEGHLPSPVPVATVRKMYTYYDESKAENGAVPKSACKLPHHFVGSDGTPGAASINGVRNALARLPQTQGLSDAERKTAEAHLRAHLNAFDGDTEDHAHTDEEVHDTAEDAAAPEDASTKKLPPFLKPDEDEEEDEDAPPEEEEPEDKADAWDSIIGLLVSDTTSPSADDVFPFMKEEW